MARTWTWVTAVAAGAATLGPALVALPADLDTAGRAASVVGAVVVPAALVASVSRSAERPHRDTGSAPDEAPSPPEAASPAAPSPRTATVGPLSPPPGS